MKRKFIEEYIDGWLANAETLASLSSIQSAAYMRQGQIFFFKKTDKKAWADEYRKLQFLHKRIQMMQPIMVQKAVETQEYLLLPEHQRCGIVRYRYLASFDILPNNVSLIDGYDCLQSLGWYHPENNPKGVVRDHKISIHFGYKNKIDPATIGHIANCQFMTMQENATKSKECSLTVKELSIRIKATDKKLRSRKI